MKRQQTNLPTKTICGIAVLIAMSIVLVSLIHFPIFPAASYLEYDPADIPILLCTFMFGPWAGLLCTGIVCVIQAFLLPNGNGIYGLLMHILATGSLVIVAGFVYNRKKSFKSAVLGMLFGIVAWVVMMIAANLLITPVFMGAPRQAVLQLLLPVIIPFNLIKPTINCLITLFIYKKIHFMFNKMLKIPPKPIPLAYPTDCSIKQEDNQNIER